MGDGTAAGRHGRRPDGLDLVAQLTQGWGTRHTTNGKIIWCAQTLTEPQPH
jgi:hypothetical protein